MSLFKTSDLVNVNAVKKSKHDSMNLSSGTDYTTLFKEDKAIKNLEECIGQLDSLTTVKFVTDGAWSMHHLLAYCLMKCGPSKVYISTWTMTEEPARHILKMKESGMIKSLTCLFDHRISTRAVGAMQLINAISDKIALIKVHAKITCIVGENMKVSIVGSANYSRNRRLEAGTIFTDPAAVDFDLKWINKFIEDAE